MRNRALHTLVDGLALETAPGATKVYVAVGSRARERPVWHADWECPRFIQAVRVNVYTLADALNYRIDGHRPCPYCVADLEVLRSVALEADEYGRPVTVQAGLEVADG